MRPLAALAAVGMLAARQPVLAAGSTLDALPARSPLTGSDILPVLPAGGATLMKTTAGDLRDLVLTSVKAYGAVGDGVTDDTAALQAAIDSGLSLYCPPGTYKTSSSLRVESPRNDGQTIRGSGSWGAPDAFNAATGGNACVIKPTSAVTRAFVIDGTPFVGGGYQQSWVQGFGLQDLVIDMALMSDVATNAAINQIQAWDVHYRNVRVIHDGSYKRGWLLIGGAFTTTLDQPWANIIDLEGVSLSYEVTTITITNPDVGKIITNFAGSVTVVGGAVQFPYVAGVTPIVWVPAGVGPLGLDGNTAGVYVAYGTDIRNSQYFTAVGTDFEAINQPPNTCTLSGWPYGTYTDGVHGCHKLVMGALIESASTGTMFSGTQNAGMYWMDQGAGSSFPVLTQGGGYPYAVTNGVQYDLGDRRVVGTMSGPVGFGGALNTETSSSYSIVGSTGVASFRESILRPLSDGVTLYFANAAGAGLGYFDTHANGTLYLPGQALLGGVAVTPASDGSIFFLKNAAGNNFMICASNVLIGSSNCGVGSGADWKGFSDSGFSVQTYDFDASTGNGTFSGTVSGARFAGALDGTVGANTPSSGNFTTIGASSGLIINSKLLISGTAPTYSSGFSASVPAINGSTTAAFTVTIGATPGVAGVLTMPSAANGWVCLASDRTTTTATIRQTATTTSSGTFALTGTASGDVLQFQCGGY